MSLTKGLTYRLKYRAANSIGWGAWSPITGIQLAKEPEAPQQPQILLTSST
jgi:hypothetical protein